MSKIVAVNYEALDTWNTYKACIIEIYIQGD